MSVHVVNDYADRTTILFIKVSAVLYTIPQKLMTNVDGLSLKLEEKKQLGVLSIRLGQFV